MPNGCYFLQRTTYPKTKKLFETKADHTTKQLIKIHHNTVKPFATHNNTIHQITNKLTHHNKQQHNTTQEVKPSYKSFYPVIFSSRNNETCLSKFDRDVGVNFLVKIMLHNVTLHKIEHGRRQQRAIENKGYGHCNHPPICGRL